ncbi:MAG: hypothetical protein IJ335_01220 [Lachnospiraceae bacterium]|nr:hypothetical protein [Lachnospiraceae bacterium]
MWNVLLDPLPEEWQGYPIDSDFQTGIQISQCLTDDTLSETEKFCTARDLLFPYVDNRPDIQEAVEALKWFLNEYHHDNNSGEKSDVPVMDFDIDQWRIYAAFLSQYHIDLNTAKLHWFTFMGLLVNLDECTFTNVMNLRQKKITPKMSSEEKKAIKQAQKVFAIKPTKEERLTLAEQMAVDEFMKYVNK